MDSDISMISVTKGYMDLSTSYYIFSLYISFSYIYNSILDSSECEDSFDLEDGKYSSGGAGQDSIDKLDDCKDACRDDDDCLGFDWTKDTGADTRCWLHTDKDKFAEKEDSDDVEQYTRKACTEGETSTSPNISIHIYYSFHIISAL